EDHAHPRHHGRGLVQWPLQLCGHAVGRGRAEHAALRARGDAGAEARRHAGGRVRGRQLTAMSEVDGGFVPKERYTTRAFLDLEMQKLWSCVWQPACREEELPSPGDYVEYAIGDQSVLIVRTGAGPIAAFHNACLHRGTRLAAGCGRFEHGHIQCPYHAWRYELDGRLAAIVDREDFGPMPEAMRLGPVRADSWGGFVFVNLDSGAEPLLEFLDPLPTLLAPYRLHEMRFRSYLTTILPANWKTVVDAFHESYHVQGAHAQILPWTDDTSIAYEQFRTHAHYG